MFTLTGRARMCPKHRSTAVIHGQQGSVRVPPGSRIAFAYRWLEGASPARGRDVEVTFEPQDGRETRPVRVGGDYPGRLGWRDR